MVPLTDCDSTEVIEVMDAVKEPSPTDPVRHKHPTPEFASRSDK